SQASRAFSERAGPRRAPARPSVISRSRCRGPSPPFTLNGRFPRYGWHLTGTNAGTRLRRRAPSAISSRATGHGQRVAPSVRGLAALERRELPAEDEFLGALIVRNVGVVGAGGIDRPADRHRDRGEVRGHVRLPTHGDGHRPARARSEIAHVAVNRDLALPIKKVSPMGPVDSLVSGAVLQSPAFRTASSCAPAFRFSFPLATPEGPAFEKVMLPSAVMFSTPPENFLYKAFGFGSKLRSAAKSPQSANCTPRCVGSWRKSFPPTLQLLTAAASARRCTRTSTSFAPNRNACRTVLS